MILRAALLVTLDLPINIQFLQISLLLLTQHLSPRFQRLIHALDTREPNNRARNALVNPRKGNMAHLPAMLLRELFDPLDNLVVRFGMARERCAVGLLAF